MCNYYLHIIKGMKMNINDIKKDTKKETIISYPDSDPNSDINKIVDKLLNSDNVKIRKKPKKGEYCVKSIDLITGKVVYQCTSDKK